MTVYAITDTKKGEQGLRLLSAYLSSNYPKVALRVYVFFVCKDVY